MKIKLIVLSISLTFLFAEKTFACDSCNFFEYSLLENKSYFGIFYRFREFKDYTAYPTSNFSAIKTLSPQLSTKLLPFENDGIMHEPEGNGLYVTKTKQDYETYQTIEARGNITLNNKWNITAVLPYEFNKVYYEKYLDLPKPTRDTTLFVQGWGDLTLATEYIHLIYNKKSRHTIRPGLAFTLPTGQALVKSTGENQEFFDPIIQPGKGAISFTPRFNYQWFLKNQGINTGFSYQWSTEGAQNYELGNSFNFFTLYYYQLNLKEKALIIPNMGFYFEMSNQDTYQGVAQELTGGSVGFAQFGLDLNFTKTTFSAVLQAPIYQSLNGNQIQNQNRINIGVIRNFKL
jgi:hypothetical protein